MNKLLLSLVFLFLVFSDLISQETYTKGFELILPTYKIKNSLYNKIDFIDSRDDTTKIGPIAVGTFKNTDAKLVFKTPFSIQLASLVNSLTDNTASNGELLFQLNRLNFTENKGMRYCYFRARLFSKQTEGYQKIASIDTLIIIVSPGVADVLMNTVSKIITDIFSNALVEKGTDGVYYSNKDIPKIDSIEKSKIPVYYAAKYTDGLYLTYRSFMNQVPDMQATVNMRGGNSISYVKIDSSGQKIKLLPKNVYAVVYKGMPFIATPFGYYPLQQIHNDLFFTGDIYVPKTTNDVVTGVMAGTALGLLGGVVGGVLANTNNEANFQIEIDYNNGGFIRLRKIITKDPDDAPSTP